MAKPIGEVLLQLAPGRDGHDLHAPADAEHRQPVSGHGGQQKFRGVAFWAGLLSQLVWGLAIASRFDIGATGQHQPVEARENCFGVLGDHALRQRW
jgi:hypothetical protein